MNEKWVCTYTSSAPAFPTGVMASSYTLPMDKSVGVSTAFSRFYCWISHGQSSWFFSEKELSDIAEQVLDSISNNPQIVSKIKEKFLKASDQLLVTADRQALLSICRTLSDSELVELLNRIIQLYREATYWVEAPNFALELRGQAMLKKRFFDFARQQKPFAKESELADVFSTLSNPTERSFVAQAELDLLKIAKAGNEKKESKLADYAKKYFWLRYDYFGPVLDASSAAEELKKLEALSGKEMEKRIQKIDHFGKKAEERLAAALDWILLPDPLKNAFQSVREFAFLYGDIKKQRISKASVGIGVILQEISRRTGLSEQELHYATTEELETIFSKNPVSKKTLADRVHKSCFVIENGGYQFLPAEQLEKIQKTFSSSDSSASRLIKGMSASSGYYRGTAAVISNPKSLANFRQGEILVTAMTSVEFVPAMKKAGAIVTDLGGITCHAAIVSRELGVPCVIGTTNATKIIRDGDLIEVDANHGVVRILEAKK